MRLSVWSAVQPEMATMQYRVSHTESFGMQMP